MPREKNETKVEQRNGRTAETPTRPKKNFNRRVEAMSHPLRARLLRRLVERECMSPSQLAREFHEDIRDVSYHVKRLVELDCAELASERPVRGAVEHFYRATERHLLDKEEWEELDPIIAEDLLFDFVRKIFDDFVASAKADIVGSDGNFHITRTPEIVGEKGFEEAMAAFEKCRLEVAEVVRKSVERLSTSGAPAIPISSSLLFFQMPREALDN